LIKRQAQLRGDKGDDFAIGFAAFGRGRHPNLQRLAQFAHDLGPLSPGDGFDFQATSLAHRYFVKAATCLVSSRFTSAIAKATAASTSARSITELCV